MVAPLVADPTRAATIVVLPQLLCDLTEIQVHVLKGVAIHCWIHDGEIPYIAPNAHQRRVALGLAAPGARLLVASSLGGRRCEFWLTRLGDLVARRVLRLSPEAMERAKEEEREFDRMRALVRNAWETHD